MSDIVGFHASAAAAAKMIMSSKDVLVVGHIDADGITAASIASKTLDRIGKEHTVIFAKKLSEDVIEEINKSKHSLVWIVDLGSGYLSQMKRSNIVVTDHHTPDPAWRKKGQLSLDNFYDICHVSPHEHGMDGSQEICGAGVTYVVSLEVDVKNKDLAYLAVVGAAGDFQDSSESRFVGYNRLILKDAVERGDVSADTDLKLFGRETRPLTQFLQFCNDPLLPGLTNDAQGCTEFLTKCNIRLKDKNGWKVWNDLTPDEKETVTDGLKGIIPADGAVDRLVGEVYTLPKFKRGSELRDAKEFATLLNSCGRYDDAETGLRICLGDDTAVKDASYNRNEHRKNISSALAYIKQNRLIRERRYLQYFDSGSEIRETIVGIAAGMLLGNDGVRKDIPIFAFAKADDGIKVSARADRSLVNRKLDLSEIMKKASEMVGGYGGGHNIAAGATIPEGKEEEFLNIAEDLIAAQLI